MRAVIIGNGKFDDFFEFLEDDFIICADGGYNHAKKIGIKPNMVIGDMDSVTVDVSEESTVVYPKEKDFTDSELAINIALDKRAEEIILLAMSGSRLDHTMANVYLLRYIERSGVSAKLIDKNNTVYYIKDKRIFLKQKGKTLSLIPINGDLTGVCEKGFYYSLNNETISFGSTRGISNIITEDEAEITITSGEGIVIITDGQ